MLNKSKGNMYSWVTDTWNPIKGVCSHGCSYCFMRKWGHLKPIRLDNSEFKTDLGKGNSSLLEVALMIGRQRFLMIGS